MKLTNAMFLTSPQEARERFFIKTRSRKTRFTGTHALADGVSNDNIFFNFRNSCATPKIIREILRLNLRDLRSKNFVTRSRECFA